MLWEVVGRHKSKAKILFWNGLGSINLLCILQKTVFLVGRVTC